MDSDTTTSADGRTVTRNGWTARRADAERWTVTDRTGTYAGTFPAEDGGRAIDLAVDERIRRNEAHVRALNAQRDSEGCDGWACYSCGEEGCAPGLDAAIEAGRGSASVLRLCPVCDSSAVFVRWMMDPAKLREIRDERHATRRAEREAKKQAAERKARRGARVSIGSGVRGSR